MLNPTDAARAGAMPFDARTTLRTLDLTDADASIALAPGVYELTHDGTVAAFAAFADTTALPSGASEVMCFVLPPNSVVGLAVDVAATLHARLRAGTGTLYLCRKVLA